MTKKCLFYQETNECSNNFSPEHIIQEGLGGSLKSSDLVCVSCNECFGNVVDPVLTDYYRPILEILAPILPGDLKRKKRKTESIPDSTPLEIHAGGHAKLRKIIKECDKNGELIGITAPEGKTREEIEAIAQKRANSFEVTSSKSYHGVCPLPNQVLLRAIMLDLIELIRYTTKRNGLQDISNHYGLSDVRNWVRHGTPANYLPTDIPFAPLSDILDAFFKPSVFSHRLAVSYDANRKSIVFVAEFVNTMPWIMILGHVNVYPSSLSIIYRKDLLTAESTQIEPSVMDDAILDFRELEWRRFSSTSYEACEFAWTKFRQQYMDQIGKARYEVDMRSDRGLIDDIGLVCLNYRGLNEGEAAPRIVADLIGVRYMDSPFVHEIKQLSHEKAKSLFSMGAIDRKLDLNEIISVYRVCLKAVAHEHSYGYPKHTHLL